MFRSPIPAISFAAAAFLLVSCATLSPGTDRLQKQTEIAVARVAPALVRIHVVEPDYRQGREVKFVAAGSGSIITPEGHVMTNHHVAGKAVRLSVTLPSREEIPATLVGTDPATDIAIIKLQPETPTLFPTVPFADSDLVEAGDAVLALGSPRGISQSVTRGIISNPAMVMPSLYRGLTFELDGENVGELVRWFAHDAEIHPGNSGGPLVNMNGEIVGVNEISFGLAGAIPGNLARKVAEEIIANGEVSRAWTGLILQPVLKSAGTDEGVLVSSVLKETPAEKAGLQTGDMILRIGSQPVDVRFFEDLPLANNILADLPIGEGVEVSYLRDGKPAVTTLTPEKRQLANPPQTEIRAWGVTVRNVSTLTQLSLAREDAGGVLITSTRPGGGAAKAKPEIRSGDVLTEAGGEKLTAVEDLLRITHDITGGEDEREPVPTLVTYERDGQSLLTVVEVGIDELNDPDLEVSKGWLPMETQVLTRDLAEKLGVEGTTGVRVTRIYDDRPEDFPFETGDLITHFDDEVIPASQPHDSEVFRTMIRQYRVGTDAEFAIIRNSKEMTVAATLVPSPRSAREMKRFRDLPFEFVVREATWEDRQNPKFEGIDVRVLADSVTEGGWASLGDLRVGDIILRIDGSPVASLADVEDAMRTIHQDRPANVVFQIRRGVQDAWLEMEPLWDGATSD